ncbi:hypothetical protein BGZ83_006973 [Gryganskiella cystojenkinii]|nr:hypothetical protein BGZ83_006973 [Gryganskiella cystojenkinii]
MEIILEEDAVVNTFVFELPVVQAPEIEALMAVMEPVITQPVIGEATVREPVINEHIIGKSVIETPSIMDRKLTMPIHSTLELNTSKAPQGQTRVNHSLFIHQIVTGEL